MKKLSLPTSPIAFWTSLLVVWVSAIWAYLEFIGVDDVEPIVFEFRERTFEILAPEYFAILLALPLLAVVSRFSLSDLPGYQRGLNLGIRALVVAAIVASLAQIVVTDFDSRISTIYLVDTSASMPDEALDDARDHINDAVDELDDDDNIEVVAFASRPYQVQPEPDGRYSAIPRPEADGDHYDTDISAAMRMAYGLFPDDHLQRIVLMTDGNQTHGDFLAEVDRAADFGIRLFSQPLDYERPPEVLIQDVDAPDDIDVGAPFYLTARIFSTHADTVDLTLWQDEFRDDERTIDVDAGTTEVRFETEVSEPGFRTFELEMDVHGRDTHDENNRFVHTAYISGEPRILYIEGEMRARHHLERALGDEDFDVETRTPAGVPRDSDDLDAFDLVLLSDAHADDFSQDQLQLFDTYVRQMGGGLIMAGGEDSFGPGGWQDTAVEDLMPVTFEGQERREDPSLAILLVIDRSGSMDEHRRMELAREAARAAVDELDDHAEIGILAFDHETTPITPIQPVTNRARIHNQIDRIQIRGGTDIALALEEAYDRIAFHPARFRHVILLTDGISDEDNIFTETMPAMRIEEITVTTVGLGDGAETSLLRRIADAGNGRFYFTNNPYQVPRIFADETRTVADSAVVEQPVGTQVTGRSQVLDGIAFEQAPYLLGYVPTTPRPEADILLSTDSGDPLLARWQVGLGRTAAFTSDLKNRWGAEWVRWQGYPQLWAQLIRDTMRTDDGERLPMRAFVDQDRGRVTVDAIGPNDQFINDLDSTVEITSPGGEIRRVPLDQTAPGIYEATFTLDEFGSYHLSAEHLLDGDSFATSQTSLSYPYPRGLSFTEANDELVERAVEVTGGTVAPTIDELFDAGDEEIRYRRHLWPYLAALALLLLVLDVGFRRVRLSGDTDISFQQLVDGR